MFSRTRPEYNFHLWVTILELAGPAAIQQLCGRIRLRSSPTRRTVMNWSASQKVTDPEVHQGLFMSRRKKGWKKARGNMLSSWCRLDEAPRYYIMLNHPGWFFPHRFVKSLECPWNENSLTHKKIGGFQKKVPGKLPGFGIASKKPPWSKCQYFGVLSCSILIGRSICSFILMLSLLGIWSGLCTRQHAVLHLFWTLPARY